MTIKTFEVNSKKKDAIASRKFDWYWSPVYCVVWFALFYVCIVPSFYYHPKTILIQNERKHHDEFIGERAHLQLMDLAGIGVKLTGSVENEVLALNYLLREIDKIKSAAHSDLYDIEVEVQHSSGDFVVWGMAMEYHNISNVIVKISSKKSHSQSYLLVNSHFDSEVGSPGAGDAGIMIVVMLETLRVISKSHKPLKHPVVFLFNGAEESNFLASHGFITQHRWASNCKAFVNLDSAGAGGREILFQSGPNHPWLLKYYHDSVPHPFANTIAEELFQNNFVPSDSDYRIFRDYGRIPGLDMAYSLNGYIYHTKHDTFKNLEPGTYQTTGDNVLALTWALANADELEDPEAYSEGHTVFYDFLGWFLISYTESTGIAINITTCVCALIAVAFSVYVMTQSKSVESSKRVYLRCLAIVFVQILTVLVAVCLTILVVVIMEAMGLSMAWYNATWMIFGLYFCPMFFVLGIVPALYIQWTREKTCLLLIDSIACFMHAHCIILVSVCLVLTALGIRSSFFVMIAVFFYTLSTILNVLGRTCCKNKFSECHFLLIHLSCQLLPFWFYTYNAFNFLTTFIPMQGRNGPENEPELIISGFSVLTSVLFAGFILPILHKFRKSKTAFSVFGALIVVFVIIAATPLGFPFKKDVAPQRFYAMHTSRIIHDISGNVSKNQSGFYIQTIDTKPRTLDTTTFKDALPPSWIDEECTTEVLCGLPIYNTRWLDWKNFSRWIPANPPILPIPTELRLVSTKFITATKVRFDFTLASADHVVIYVDPYTNVKVSNWSFNRIPLDEHYQTPYFIHFTYSMVDAPLKFWIEVESESRTNEDPYFRLAVGSHFLYHSHVYTSEFNEFLNTFQEWTYPTTWISSFESWSF